MGRSRSPTSGLRSTVVCKVVDSARRNAAEGILGRKALDLGLQGSWGGVAITRNEVSQQASNMGRGHGSAGNVVRRGRAADPGRGDSSTRSKNVYERERFSFLHIGLLMAFRD
jgi:hypothetical protein